MRITSTRWRKKRRVTNNESGEYRGVTKSTMQKILDSQVNFVLAVVTIFLGVATGAVGGTLFARDTIYDYTLTVPNGQGEPVLLQYGTWPELSNIDFFRTVRDEFIADQANFVEANLTAMTLTVYREGVPALTVPIKSKGKEGSWWETPSGLYRAEAKEDTHFSSFGHVYMPWSIPFQGNFFIHGWPYHEDGTPVPEGYSGGCMRLEDVYAKQVYDLVEVGMPILVFEDAQIAGETVPYALQAPNVSAQSYLVADLDSNFVLLASAGDTPHETNTIGYLMAALVASEHQNIEKTITVREDDVDGVGSEGIRAGATYSLYDLFFPLLGVGSSNTVGVLAGYFGEKRFSTLMEAKAGALGMKHTLITGVGRTMAETTTAEDVFLLLKYLHTNRPFILGMSAGKTNLATYGVPSLVATSTHPFATDVRFGGGVGSTGGVPPVSRDAAAAVALAFATSTQAQKGGSADLLSVFSLTFEGGTRNVAMIVLDSPDPAHDTRAMLEYAQRMYR